MPSVRRVRSKIPTVLAAEGYGSTNQRHYDAHKNTVLRGTGMKRFLSELFGRVHARAEIRRKRSLQQAAREMDRRDPHGGSIWRSGKGGSHPG